MKISNGFWVRKLLFPSEMQLKSSIFILKAVFFLIFTQETALATPMDAFQLKVQQRMRARLSMRVNESMPNCYNTALYTLGATSRIGYSDDHAMVSFLADGLDPSRGGKLHCRCVDIQGGEPVQFGDLGIIGYLVYKGSSGLGHAFVVVDERTVFEKGATGEQHPVMRTSVKEALSHYFIKELEHESPQANDLFKRLGCRIGATEEYTLNATVYNNLTPSCEIFRCRPRP